MSLTFYGERRPGFSGQIGCMRAPVCADIPDWGGSVAAVCTLVHRKHSTMHRVIRNRRVGSTTAGCAVILLAFQFQGCATFVKQHEMAGIAYADLPRELDKVTLPTYRVEPPDILLIEAVNNIRTPDTPLEVGDQLFVQLQNGLPLDPPGDPVDNPLQYEAELQVELDFKQVNRPYLIGVDGTVDLGPAYGSVPVVGLTLDEAKAAIEQHLRQPPASLTNPVVSVELTDIAGKQPVTGEHLVRPDGTVSLGIYGQVHVAGMTLEDVQWAVERHLSQYMNNPQINVDVLAYNSKVIYVITDGGGFGESIVRLPVTGNETVLDAIAQIQGLSEVSSKKIWVARPAPSELGYAQILDVHWEAITAEGMTATNYQLLPGDRIYISADHLIATDNFLAKLLAPAERVAGVILLYTGLVSRIDFYERSGTGGAF